MRRSDIESKCVQLPNIPVVSSHFRAAVEIATTIYMQVLSRAAQTLKTLPCGDYGDFFICAESNSTWRPGECHKSICGVDVNAKPGLNVVGKLTYAEGNFQLSECISTGF